MRRWLIFSKTSSRIYFEFRSDWLARCLLVSSNGAVSLLERWTLPMSLRISPVSLMRQPDWEAADEAVFNGMWEQYQEMNA
jgi:hypothetical protein